MRLFTAIILAIVANLQSAVAQGSPVYLESGIREGQGLAFYSPSRDVDGVAKCYVVAPQHVAGTAGERLRAADLQGQIIEGVVISSANSADLALASLQLPMSRLLSRGATCAQMSDKIAIYPEVELAALSGLRLFGTRVSARAGGLELVPFRLATIAGGALTLQPANASEVIQSDSGMALWSITETAADVRERDLLRKARLVGFVRGVTNKGVDAIAAETASRIVYDLIAPIDPARLVHPTSKAAVLRVERGRKAEIAERLQRGLPPYPSVFHDSDNLDSVSLLFDLGDRDNIYKGTAIGATLQIPPRVRVFVSRSRPGDGAEWTQVDCQRGRAGAPGEYFCAPAEAQIVRGVWVQVTAPLDRVYGVRIEREEIR